MDMKFKYIFHVDLLTVTCTTTPYADSALCIVLCSWWLL